MLKYLNPPITFHTLVMDEDTGVSHALICESCKQIYGLDSAIEENEDEDCFVQRCSNIATHSFLIDPNELEGFKHSDLL